MLYPTTVSEQRADTGVTKAYADIKHGFHGGAFSFLEGGRPLRCSPQHGDSIQTLIVSGDSLISRNSLRLQEESACEEARRVSFNCTMAQLVRSFYDGYRDLMDNKSDPRVNNWAMMSSPFPTLAICLSYVYFVKVLGPKLMENRKPFDLRRVMIFYNLFQVIFSTWLFYESLVSGWGSHYSFRCQPVDYSNNPLALRMTHGCWWYYFSKFTEFLDTIFFVLRKKNNHISTLHVIHHGCMPMSVWFGVKFTPGGHSTFFGLLNTFVHIVMYSYYLLSALGPKIQPYLWWKKYLTALQMIQFILVMVHAFQLLFIDCNYPKAFVWWIGLHAVMFYFLFRDFYTQSYRKRKSSMLSKKEKDQTVDARKQQDESAVQSNAKKNSMIYANQYKMATGYISDSGLRNRVFIDNRGFNE